MDLHWYLKTAFQDLEQARSNLNADHTSSRACDKVWTATHWAMDYWLLQANQADGYHDWASVRQRFNLALDDDDPIIDLLYCSYDAGVLENKLDGWPESEDPEHPVKPIDLQELRDDVAKLIRYTRSLLDLLPVADECPKEFRLTLEGFNARYHVIEWQGAHLACIYQNPYLRPTYPAAHLPEADEWQRFWDIADRIDLWHWPQCMGEKNGGNGQHLIPRWQLHISHQGRTIHTGGPAQFPTDRRVAALFQAVKRVLGVPVYWVG